MLRRLIRVILSLSSISHVLDLVALSEVDCLSLTKVFLDHVDFTLLTRVSCLARLQFVRHPLQLLLFVVVISASRSELGEKLHLVLFFNSVELSELIKLSNETVNDLHAFIQFSTALLVAAVLFTLYVISFVPEVVDLVLQRVDIALLGSQLHHFLPQFVHQCILVPLSCGCL